MPARKRLSAVMFVSLTASLAAVPPLAAQESRYGTAGAGGIQGLVEELRVLVDEAERARAADPRFLRDLRTLAGRYDRPWQVSLVHDSFADGDFHRSPAWTVTSGSFRVEQGWGLLSDVQAPEPAASGSGDAKKDLAAALITGLLSQYSQQGQQGQQAAPTQSTSAARIETRARISNAFSVETVVSSEAGSRQLEIAMFQGSGAGPSYVLVYAPNDPAPLELRRRGSRGVAVIDAVRSPLGSGDPGRRKIAWSRSDNGEMVVSVDDRELLRTRDNSLRDPFDGLAFSNQGGRFLIREVTVTGQP